MPEENTMTTLSKAVRMATSDYQKRLIRQREIADCLASNPNIGVLMIDGEERYYDSNRVSKYSAFRYAYTGPEMLLPDYEGARQWVRISI
jgi:hypothetical protein